MLKKQWLDRGPCPKCKSSDANVKHKQGYSYCFSCDTRFGDNVTVVPKQEWTVKPMSTTGSWVILVIVRSLWIPQRNIVQR